MDLYQSSGGAVYSNLQKIGRGSMDIEIKFMIFDLSVTHKKEASQTSSDNSPNCVRTS